ncbi:hypothetical protein NEHOM01_2425 [Nematocida homosporus]|uniref:uncharacterized protein n=1 Tax=Nematocida homosporus TaxID=1912981 RepID=UPI002220F554|nr:uncharacterized protein NEHOM01_2425 [Nematocida homosporus]KAI5187881.1 hypothetical protein NEHOM01_2425 [Nematocida homosporus]
MSAETDAFIGLSRDKIALLEKYVDQELDPSDHTGFLAICDIFGLKCPGNLVGVRERVELLCKFKDLCTSFGVEISHDFEALLVEIKKKEEIERLDQENDRMEIELIRTQKGLSELYIKESKLKELTEEKNALVERVQQIERIEKYSLFSLEIVQLAKTLMIDTKERKDGSVCFDSGGYLEEFHLLFLPFVNLSANAVNFLYNQLVVPSSDINKEKAVNRYLEHLKALALLKERKECVKNPNLKRDWELVELVAQRPNYPVDELCRVLHAPRAEIIERVFLLSAKDVLVFNRAADTVRIK